MIEMDVNHTGVITKTRAATGLDRRTFRKPGAEIAEILTRWLSGGAATPKADPFERFAPIAQHPTETGRRRKGGRSGGRITLTIGR